MQICKHCCDKFKKQYPNQRYCSPKCRKEYYKKRYKSDYNQRKADEMGYRECKLCKEQFFRDMHVDGYNGYFYCSYECAALTKQAKDFIRKRKLEYRIKQRKYSKKYYQKMKKKKNSM